MIPRPTISILLEAGAVWKLVMPPDSPNAFANGVFEHLRRSGETSAAELADDRLAILPRSFLFSEG